MNRIIQTILIISATALNAAPTHANEGEYYPGISMETFNRMTGFSHARLDPASTGSIGTARPATTSRDNRFMVDHGDYYEGVSRQ